MSLLSWLNHFKKEEGDVYVSMSNVKILRKRNTTELESENKNFFSCNNIMVVSGSDVPFQKRKQKTIKFLVGAGKVRRTPTEAAAAGARLRPVGGAARLHVGRPNARLRRRRQVMAQSPSFHRQNTSKLFSSPHNKDLKARPLATKTCPSYVEMLKNALKIGLRTSKYGNGVDRRSSNAPIAIISSLEHVKAHF